MTSPHAITALTLQNFRNYRELTLNLSAAPVVLFGRNGAGKTNILEALSLLAPGRGLRGAKLKEMDSHQVFVATGVQPTSDARIPTAWVVAAKLTNYGAEAHIGTGRDAESAMEKRIIKINGERIRGASQLSAHTCIQWLTPSMDQVFIEGGTIRRKFFDRIVYGFAPEHAARVLAYEAAMRERNKLLAEDRRADPYWLSVIEQQMAEHAVAITLARQETLQRLQAELITDIAHFPRAQIHLSGTIEDLLHEGHSALEVEGIFAQRLHHERPIDAARRRTGIGPQRSVWTVIHSEKNCEAEQCSTGEQKALILSILLAAARARAHWCGMAPILLLDEVIAHLDPEKRTQLFALLRASNIQAWMTGTDAKDFAGIDATMLEIDGGKVL